MKTFLSYLVPKVSLRKTLSKDGVKPHILPFLGVCITMMAFYYASQYIPPGWFTYTLSSIACAFIGVTALARVNDIANDQTEFRWQLRRLGLILVGAASTGLVLGPLLAIYGGNVIVADWPSWREVMLRAGFACVWLTTPQMPPWHYYMSGEYKKVRVVVPIDAVVEIDRLPKESNDDLTNVTIEPTDTPVG